MTRVPSAPSTTMPGTSGASGSTRLGGPPSGATPRLIDPILFGRQPTARADGLAELGRWAEAEAAFAEAIRARPRARSVWVEPGSLPLRARPSGARRHDRLRGHPAPARRAHPPRAGGPRAPRGRRPGRPATRHRQPAGSIRRDDRPGCSQHGRLGLRAGARGDRRSRGGSASGRDGRRSRVPEPTGRLLSTRSAPRFTAPAGSTRRSAGWRKGFRSGAGRGVPQDWAFLAMAHFRLGHRDLARRWLDRFRDRSPTPPSRRSGTSWKSASSAARPRPSSSTTRRSPMTQSLAENLLWKGRVAIS